MIDRALEVVLAVWFWRHRAQVVDSITVDDDDDRPLLACSCSCGGAITIRGHRPNLNIVNATCPAMLARMWLVRRRRARRLPSARLLP